MMQLELGIDMVLTQAVKEKFMTLACKLSPENLCCDGELPKAEVRRRFRNLSGEWRALERKLGRVVEEDEVWQWEMEKENK